MIATHLTERLGKQFIAENRTGAGGVVGSELVAKSPKDGYTLLIVSIAHAVNPWLYKLPYDPDKVLHADRSRHVQRERARGQRRPAGQVDAGIHRARQGEAGQDSSMPPAGSAARCISPWSGSSSRPASIFCTCRSAARGPASSMLSAATPRRSTPRSRRCRRISAAASCGRSASAAPSAVHVLPEVPTIEEQGVLGLRGRQLVWACGSGRYARRHHRKAAQGNLRPCRTCRRSRSRSPMTAPIILRMSPREFAAFMDSEMAKWGQVIKQAGIKAQ